MKAEIKQRWIEALESGDYLQERGALCYFNGQTAGYCCLGVLCDLHSKETNTPWTPEPGDRSGNFLSYLKSCAGLPHEVIAWAGFEEKEQLYIDMNDSDARSFKEIAAVIRTSG